MRRIGGQFKCFFLLLTGVSILLLTMDLGLSAATGVTLSNASFNGLTRIAATTNVQLTGLDAAHVIITRPDGQVVPPAKIAGINVAGKTLSIVIDAGQLARTSSQGTTLATRAFGSFAASRAVRVLKPGEPTINGHITGSSAWTDEGWSTSKTDPGFYDPITGQTGLYRFTDLTPDRDDNDRPVAWKDGNIVTPAHKVKKMLVLFVEFPDRRAADAGDPYTTIPAYLDFLQGAVDWFRLSSYGQLSFELASPQNSDHLGWIMMSRNAGQYPWTGQTHTMFAYVREACQTAYDKWNIKADDYDMLLIMPARGKPGLSNGPSNINRDPTDGEEPNTNLAAFLDRNNTPHYIGTALTAGNDMYRWGYRWLIHESGHAFGFPDLYMYAPTVNGTRVGQFFYCGGWDMMGNIAGHSTDYLAWHKWKLRWIRDDQVDVVSQSGANPSTHFLTPVETPGGSKMVVIRTGLSTAYVAEFRTRLGVNALDNRGKYSGILLYRIDASKWEARDKSPTAQIISKQFYNSPAVGGPKNLTGVWRPIDNTLTGYDSADCTWQPGDVFADPATGVTISIDGITHYSPSDPSNSPYTADDVATLRVTKTMSAVLLQSVTLSNAQLRGLTNLTFDTSVELQQRIPNANAGNRGTYAYIREESVLKADNLIITKANRSVMPARLITGIVVKPSGVEVTLAKGAFASEADAARATVATRGYYNFAAGQAVPVRVSK